MQPNKTAFIFPGQGSQKVGMGAALAQAYPLARQVFEQADRILGYPLSRVYPIDCNTLAPSMVSAITTTRKRPT